MEVLVLEKFSKDIEISVYNGIYHDKSVLEPCEKSIIIGRHSECSIHIEDNLLSKNQCNIEYNEANSKITL